MGGQLDGDEGGLLCGDDRHLEGLKGVWASILCRRNIFDDHKVGIKWHALELEGSQGGSSMVGRRKRHKIRLE